MPTQPDLIRRLAGQGWSLQKPGRPARLTPGPDGAMLPARAAARLGYRGARWRRCWTVSRSSGDGRWSHYVIVYTGLFRPAMCGAGAVMVVDERAKEPMFIYSCDEAALAELAAEPPRTHTAARARADELTGEHGAVWTNGGSHR